MPHTRRYRHADSTRAHLAQRGAPHARGVTDTRLQQLALLVISKGGKPIDAADALCIYPRPTWVLDICGSYPIAFELTNQDDIASIQDYGSSGTAPQ